MNLRFDSTLAAPYKSPAQRIRVMAERWLAEEVYCPQCGGALTPFESNRPVADFFCRHCHEEFELKSKKDRFGKKVVDGAYRTMIDRIRSRANPNFFFLTYEQRHLEVVNLMIIPKHFFIPDIIEKRKPLSPHARRAGWVGCNILLEKIPSSGRIFMVHEGKTKKKSEVLSRWEKTLFLRKQKNLEAKGWLLDIMRCIDELRKEKFTLEEMYRFEHLLRDKHPQNKHIKDKIRQQLQVLRDRGYLEFVERGKYRLR